MLVVAKFSLAHLANTSHLFWRGCFSANAVTQDNSLFSPRVHSFSHCLSVIDTASKASSGLGNLPSMLTHLKPELILKLSGHCSITGDVHMSSGRQGQSYTSKHVLKLVDVVMKTLSK